MTSFKELCLDVNDTDPALGEFWSALLGVPFVPGRGEDDPGNLLGEPEGVGIAFCPVPEPKTVKNRAHLDVHVASLDDVVALGATIQDRHDHWTVCTDPWGNEFCAFVRDHELPAYRVYELAVDAADPERIARWWAGVFGVEPHNDGKDPWWWLEDVEGMPFEAMVFGPVPEPKTVKNRLHWDVYGDVAELEAAGATRLWEMPRWTVLADPEGNEFCVFAPPA